MAELDLVRSYERVALSLMKYYVFYPDKPDIGKKLEAADQRTAAAEFFAQHSRSEDRLISVVPRGMLSTVVQFRTVEFMDDSMRQSMSGAPLLGELCPRASIHCYLHTGELQTGPYLPEQIKTMWRSGAITADATLSWDGHAERVSVPTILKNPNFGSADSLSPTSEAGVSEEETSSPHPLPLIAAGAMLIGFFLPWAQLFGFGASGYNLGQLGSYGNFAWVIPIAAVVVIIVNLTVADTEARSIQVIAGIIPWGALFYGLSEAGSNLFQILSIGPYVILAAGLVLIFCPSRVAAET